MERRDQAIIDRRVVCPHCRYVFEDCWEWEDHSDVETCSECDGKFTWEREVEVQYRSSKFDATARAKDS